MKSPSFGARFSAVLAMLVLIEGRGFKANRGGMFNGPPGSAVGQNFGPANPGSFGYTGMPGLTTNSSSQTPFKQTTGVPISPTGALYQSQRYTSATALTPAVSGMFLINVAVEGGATPGGYAITYNVPSVAIWTSPTSATDATGAIGAVRCINYPTNWALGGTNIGSGNTSFKGGLGAVTVTFSTMPGNGADISAYRAVYVTGTESGTSGTSRTITFDAQPGIVRAVIVMINNATTGTATGIPAGNVTYPSNGQYQQQIAGQGPTSELQLVGVQPFGASNTVTTTHTATTLGGSTTFTIAAVHFY